MTIMNRRVAISGLATVAAAGVPLGFAMPSSATERHPDADLLALGTQFEVAFREWRNLSHAEDKVSTDFEAEADTRGIRRSSKDWWALRTELLEPTMHITSRAMEKVDGITDMIREEPARTISGLAVKAKALRHDMGKFGESSAPMELWDWDELCLETFIRDLEAMAKAARAPDLI